MRQLIYLFLSVLLITTGYQNAYACSTWRASSKEARAQQRQLDALDRKLKRLKKQADIVAVGTFTEVASEEKEDGVPDGIGAISVERVLRGSASASLTVRFTPFDLSNYCRPQFVPESGQRAKYFILNGRIVASEEANR